MSGYSDVGYHLGWSVPVGGMEESLEYRGDKQNPLRWLELKKRNTYYD